MKRHGWVASAGDPSPKSPRGLSSPGSPRARSSPVASRAHEEKAVPASLADGESPEQPTRRTRRRHSRPPAPTGDGGDDGDEKPLQTMFFLDWDDTLLPTTHLRTAGCVASSGALVGTVPSSLRVELLALEREVCDLVEKAQEQPGAVVCIVTNASDGWVQSSAAEFMPAVAAAIEARHIRVRHARTSSAAKDLAEGGGGGSGKSVLNPARWKADVFWEELAPLRWRPSTPRKDSPPASPETDWQLVNGLEEESIQHCEPRSVRIVSIGDSQWERTAASVVGRAGDIIVTVKLAASPSCAALRQQLRRIRQAMGQLATAKHSASINAVAQKSKNKAKVTPS